MQPVVPMAAELGYLAWSVLLLLVHVGVQGALSTLEQGATYNAGPRDKARKPAGVHAGRAERALRNFLETYPAFVGLALALAVTGQGGGAGAALWFWARVAYVPLYLFGIPYARTFAWIVSVAGLLMMLASLLG